MNPVGRLYYNASTMICVPTSLDQEVGEGLGAQAGETKLTEVIRDGGFTRVRWLYSKQIKPTSAIVSVARGVRLDGFLPRRAPRLAIF